MKWRFEASGYIEAETRTEAWKKAQALVEPETMTITAVALEPEDE